MLGHHAPFGDDSFAHLAGVLRAGDFLDLKRELLADKAFQLRRLPPPNGLCGLETGPETFQIVANNDAQAAELKRFNGKEVSLKVDEVACAQDAGEMSEAIVTKWSVVTKP